MPATLDGHIAFSILTPDCNDWVFDLLEILWKTELLLLILNLPLPSRLAFWNATPATANIMGRNAPGWLRVIMSI
jgi:hypothetical protein